MSTIKKSLPLRTVLIFSRTPDLIKMPLCVAQRGFSLIELMVVVSILAISLGLAIPSLAPIFAEKRLNNAADLLTSHLQLARTEAMKRGVNARVTVTPNTNGDWSTGWTVFVDTTNNANGGVAPTAAVPNGNTILKVADSLPSNLTRDAALTTATYVSYIATGTAMVTSSDAAAAGFVKSTGGYQTGTVRFTWKGGDKSRCVKLVAPGVVDVTVNQAGCT